MNLLVQNLSEIWGLEVSNKWRKNNNLFHLKTSTGQKIGLLGGKKY